MIFKKNQEGIAILHKFIILQQFLVQLIFLLIFNKKMEKLLLLIEKIELKLQK